MSEWRSRLTERRKRLQITFLATLFLAQGFHTGVWVLLLNDLVAALRMTPSSLGFALGILSISGIASIILGGRVADRVGRRLIVGVAVAGTAGFYLLLATVTSYAVLVPILLLGGASFGLFGLISVVGSDYEEQHRETAMPRLHTGFNVGAAVGVAVAAVLSATELLSFRQIYLALGCALALLIVPTLRAPFPRANGGARREPSARTDRPERKMIYSSHVIGLAAMVALAFFMGGALEGYASVYLHTDVGGSAIGSGVALTALFLAGAVGRVLSVALLPRLGTRRVLVWCGLLSALSCVVLALATNSALAAAAMLGQGVALAPVIPIGFSAAGRAATTDKGRVIASVNASGYVAATVGPVILGQVAQYVDSLRVAIGLLALAGIVLSVISARMRNLSVQM